MSDTIRTELKTDAARVWNLYAHHTYGSGDLPVIACREALQNAVDAIRRALATGEISRGRFEASFDGAVLAFDDNGCGMDHAQLHEVFLTLGGSGKASETATSATGGFGVAKAVILGCSPTATWSIHSRDNFVPSAHLGREVPLAEQKRELRQGTRIEVAGFSGPAECYDDRAAGRAPLVARLRTLLSACDLPDVDLVVNGEPIEPMFPRERGAPIEVSGTWGDGVAAVSAAGFGHVPGTGGPHYFVRVNGLVQHRRSVGWDCSLRQDIIVDLVPAGRPDSEGYPLTTSRDALRGEARRGFEVWSRDLEASNQTVPEPEWEIIDPDAEANAAFAAARDEFLGRVLKTGALAGLALPLLEAPKPAPSAPSITVALAGAGLDLDAGTLAALAEDVDGVDAGTREVIVERLVERAAEAWEVGGGGLGVVLAAQAAVAELGQEGRVAVPGVYIRISRRNYDPSRAAMFKQNPTSHLPMLLAWDAVCRLASTAADRPHGFRPGFVLDATVRTCVVEENGARYVLVNPDWLRATMDALRARSDGWRLLAVAVHAMACHELAHLGRDPDGHDDRWAGRRDDIVLASLHTLPAIERVLSTALAKLPVRADGKDELAASLVVAVRRHAEREASTSPSWQRVLTMSDVELRRIIGRSATEAGAIRYVAAAIR